jgi:hypothetical protein
MEQTKSSDNLSIYVSSFDDYSDIWPSFFKRFFKNWGDCPYPVHLGAVAKEYPDSRVKALHAGDHRNWSSRALEHLQQLNSTYVLMMLEDYMIDRPVDSAQIEQVVRLMTLYDLHAVRLFPDPAPVVGMPGVPMLGYQGEGQLNRTNTHATIWRRQTLLEIIRPGESLWEFEINGSIRSNRYPGGICGCWQPVIHYVMAIGKGRWFRKGLRSLHRDGIYPDLRERPAETRGEELRAWIEAMVGGLIRALLPLHLRQRLKLRVCPNAYKR